MRTDFFKKHFFVPGWLNTWRPYFLIFALGFLLYGQTLFFGYTYFDDHELILNKGAILQDIKNIPSIFSTDAFFSGDKFYYRPILNLSFMIDAQFGGELPFFFHLSNTLLHILTVILIFIFFKKIRINEKLSFFFALLFLVHPVLTQAVAWLPGRNDSLLTIFSLLSFIAFLNFIDKPKLKFYLSYLIFFFLALLSKETAVFLPVLIILYYIFIDSKRLLKSDKFLFVFGSFVVGFIWFLMRSVALGGEPVNYIKAILGIIKNSPAILVGLGKLVLPFNLSVLPILADSTIIYGALVLLTLIVILFFSKQKRLNFIIFGLLWFLFFLLPSFIRLNALPNFLEHRLYLSLIGFFIILMEIDWIKQMDFNKKNIIIISFSILITFSSITIFHSTNFRDRLTFWKSAASSSPHSPLAQRNLGAMYYLEGDLDKAEISFRQALILNPNEAMAHNNLAAIYIDRGDLVRAEAELNKELALYPNYDIALFNLGRVYYQKKEYQSAALLWQKALQANPSNYQAYLSLQELESRQKED